MHSVEGKRSFEMTLLWKKPTPGKYLDQGKRPDPFCTKGDQPKSKGWPVLAE